MKHFRRAFAVDLRRSLGSVSFLVTVLLLFFWEFLNTFVLLTTNNGFSAPFLLNLSVTGDFSHMLFCIAAICYGWSYCMDKSSGFFQQSVQRVGIRAYCTSKVLATMFSAFLAMVCSMSLYYLMVHIQCLRRNLPMEYGLNGYMTLGNLGKPGLYFLFRFLHTGLTCAFAAVLGLCISAFARNICFAIFAPLLFYMTACVLSEICGTPEAWTPHAIFMDEQFPGRDVFSFLVSAALLLVGMAVLGLLFYIKAEKER